MNYYGIILGAIAFLSIGIFHPLVIKTEYYFGTKSWIAFLIIGVTMIILSLIIKNIIISTTLGVMGFSSLWGIGEVFKQADRVKKGWFPKNPKRNCPND